MDELKTMIRALAISNAANGITVAQLSKDFKNLEGCAIPYSSLGFQSLDGMLRSMTDAIRVSGYGPTAVVQPLSNEKSQHVREMVKMSKPLKKKPSLHNRTPYANFGNNFYYDRYSSHIDDSFENGYNDETANSKAFYTKETNNNTLPQHLHNDKRVIRDDIDKEKLPKSTEIPAHKRVEISPDTKNQREKTPDETTNPLAEEYKQTNRAISTAIIEQHVKKMNGSLPMSNVTVPVEAMTIKEKIMEEALTTHMKPKESIQVVVTSVLNPRHIFVHLFKHTEKLLRLAPYIDNLYSAKMTEYHWLIPEGMVEVGLYCAAKYHGRWYRAQVMGPVNYQRALLMYIDYGYLRYVPLKEVRFLTRELAAIPRQAIRVGLKYLKPSNGTWSKECCEQLAHMVHRKTFQMHDIDMDVKENMLNVVLTDSATSSVDSHVHDTDEGNVNRQLALRDDIAWSTD